LTYDAYGNLKTVTGPANHRGQRCGTAYTYDAVVNSYVVSVTDSFGYTSTAEYDPRWGAAVKSVYLNGQIIASAFDDKGRGTTVTGPYQ
jgi:hypothetical protein